MIKILMKNKLWIILIALIVVFISHIHIQKVKRERVKREEKKKTDVILERLETGNERLGANGKAVHFVPVKNDIQNLQQV